jgi:hypothetical protein
MGISFGDEINKNRIKKMEIQGVYRRAIYPNKG